MSTSQSTKQCDAIVVGAGPGGYVAAIRMAQLGLSVTIIEREHLGGICLNWGCIPTKAMLRSAEVFHLMQRASEFGLKTSEIAVDLDAVVKRSRQVATQLRTGVGHLMKKNRISVVMGEACVIAPDHVAVTSETGKNTITAPHIILATGAHPRELDTLPADGKRVWNYRHALQPPHRPEKLLVVGSGAIGIEFASFFNTLGVETTVVEVLDRILPGEDEEISALAHKAFLRQGMKLVAGARITVEEAGRNGTKVKIESQDGTKSEVFDTIVSAVGITGNTEGLGLEGLGIQVASGHVVTDPHCHTGVAGIYAIGDLAGPPWLAHKASHEGVMVAELVAGKAVTPLTPGSIAGCTYCNPQIASVGLTEAGARKAGHAIKVGRFPFIGNGKAIALGDTEGMIKTIFDEKTGELLGAHMIGAEVTELIQGYVIGRQLETTETDLMHAVFPHPTLSEMMHESVLAAYDRAIHF